MLGLRGCTVHAPGFRRHSVFAGAQYKQNFANGKNFARALDCHLIFFAVSKISALTRHAKPPSCTRNIAQRAKATAHPPSHTRNLTPAKPCKPAPAPSHACTPHENRAQGSVTATSPATTSDRPGKARPHGLPAAIHSPARYFSPSAV